jgi:hypothetical protein
MLLYSPVLLAPEDPMQAPPSMRRPSSRHETWGTRTAAAGYPSTPLEYVTRHPSASKKS